MKTLRLVLVLLCLPGLSALAQKAKVQTASNFYKEPYQQYDKAKEAIDEATVHESTSGDAKTWYVRGKIYFALKGNEKYGHLCDNCLMTAYESWKKAMELDPKNEWAEEITRQWIPGVANAFFAEGVEKFKAEDYAGALTAFETVKMISPTDTAVIQNSAYSAERSGQTKKAIGYYEELIAMDMPDDKIYLSASNLYKQEGDTAKALDLVRKGRAKFPDSLNLMLAEINILLTTGKNAEATKALDEAIAKDPNNQNLYLALGSTYDNLANPRDAQQKELPKPADYEAYIAKAEDAYKKGLAINPDNYELNYNLGALYFNQAAELANQANSIKNNDEFAKAKLKFDQKFQDAEPFLEKALDKNPKATAEDMQIYEGTLNSLRQLYVRLEKMEKYEKIKQLMGAK